MDKVEISKRLIEVVKGARHPFYTHVTDKAKKYRTLITGAGMDDLLRQFVRREDKDLFKQRVRLTKHVTKAVSNNLLDPVYKLTKARYQVVLEHDNEDKLKVIMASRNHYWGTKSLDHWMRQRFIKLNATDPNAFHVIEFAPFDHTKENAAPYPFEVSSIKAVDYRYTNNTLDYLVVSGSVPVMEDGKKVEGLKLTAYLANETVILSQVESKGLPVKNVEEIFQFDEVYYVWIEKKVYRYNFPTPHNAGMVPAVRVGAFLDTETDDYTAVGLIDRVVEYLEKTIKINSELDLTMTLMAHPFMLRYVESCDAPGCMSGTLVDGSGQCPACNGTGNKKTPTTAAEVMEVKMPKRLDGEKLPALDDLLTFKTPPVEIAKFQDEYIEKICDKAKRLMYSADTMTRREVGMTATGENIDLQNVYDFLAVIAEQYSAVWEYVIKVMAKFTGTSEGLVAALVFPKDFKLKSYDELIQDLKSAQEVAAPEIRRQINADIVQTLYSDDPYALKRYKIKDLFNPFAGLSSAEIMLMMAGNLVLKRDKVLYANMGRIFDKLEVEAATAPVPADFYEMTKEKQKAAIEREVDIILQELASEAPQLTIE